MIATNGYHKIWASIWTYDKMIVRTSNHLRHFDCQIMLLSLRISKDIRQNDCEIGGIPLFFRLIYDKMIVGTVPLPCFRAYLRQDLKFIDFCRKTNIIVV